MTIEQRAMQAAKSSAPATSILNPAFVYVPANKTDVAETFRRVRERMAERPANVKQIKQKVKAC